MRVTGGRTSAGRRPRRARGAGRPDPWRTVRRPGHVPVPGARSRSGAPRTPPPRSAPTPGRPVPWGRYRTVTAATAGGVRAPSATPAPRGASAGAGAGARGEAGAEAGDRVRVAVVRSLRPPVPYRRRSPPPGPVPAHAPVPHAPAHGKGPRLRAQVPARTAQLRPPALARAPQMRPPIPESVMSQKGMTSQDETECQREGKYQGEVMCQEQRKYQPARFARTGLLSRTPMASRNVRQRLPEPRRGRQPERPTWKRTRTSRVEQSARSS